MTKSKMGNRYAPAVRVRAVRMVFEHQGSYETQAAAIAAIAPKIGCIPQTLRGWVTQAEKDSGMRDGVTTEERDRIKALERENRELRQANEILRKASAYFAPPLGDCMAITCRAMGRNSTAHSSDDRLHSLPDRACLHARDGTINALFTVSSRSAGCCRSRRQLITIIWHALPILPKPRHAISATQNCARSSNGSGMTIIRSTVFEKPGIS